MDRKAWLTDRLDGRSRILEIGPSYSPIAPKAQSWQTYIVDHASKDDLIRKYAIEGVETEAIEDVDAVWTSGPLSDAVPAALHGTFDAVIASHVLEHVPNYLGFLHSAESLLKPAGSIRLALPDRRYCFDFFKPITTTGDVLEAYAEKRSRHSVATLWNQSAYSVRLSANVSWPPALTSRVGFAGAFPSRATVDDKFLSTSNTEYLDCHAWHFTPAAFRLVQLELAQLGLSSWQVDTLETNGAEFLAVLHRAAEPIADAAVLQEQRLALLYASLAEVGEQVALAARDFPAARAASSAADWGGVRFLRSPARRIASS